MLQSGAGTLQLTGMTGKKMRLGIPGFERTAIIGRDDTANTLTYDSTVTYYSGAAGYTDTLKVSQAATISLLNNTSTYYQDIDNVDASSASGSTILAGNAGSNVLTASQGGSNIWGGLGGSDTLIAGSGQDTFWYGSGDGSDTIQGASSTDILYLYDPTFRCSSLVQKGSDLVIGNASGGSLTIQNWTGSTTLQLSDSSQYTLTTNSSGSFVALRK